MSDYLHGSEPFFLDRIDSSMEHLLTSVHEIEKMLPAASDVKQALSDVIETKEILPRILDAFRELLNVQNEFAQRIRDDDKRRMAERRALQHEEFTFLIYQFRRYIHDYSDFVTFYIGTLDVLELQKVGDVFGAFLGTVTREAEARVRSIAKSAELLSEDAKRQ